MLVGIDVLDVVRMEKFVQNEHSLDKFFFCLFNYFVITLIPSVRIISRQSKLYARRWGHNGE